MRLRDLRVLYGDLRDKPFLTSQRHALKLLFEYIIYIKYCLDINNVGRQEENYRKEV
jgi:hypothetical protein